MTPRTKYIAAGAALAALALGGAAAIARHGNHGFGHGGWRHHGGSMEGHMGGHLGGMGFGGPGMKFCRGNTAEMADHMLVRIEHKVKPTDAQKASFETLKAAAQEAAAKLSAACPKDMAAKPAEGDASQARSTPIERLARAEAMTQATLDAIKTVRPAAETFYASLTPEQKAKLDEHVGRGGRGHGEREWNRDDRSGDQNRDGKGSEDGTPHAP